MTLCAKFGWNWPSGSRKEDENVKSLQTDWQVIRKAYLAPHELSLWDEEKKIRESGGFFWGGSKEEKAYSWGPRGG